MYIRIVLEFYKVILKIIQKLLTNKTLGMLSMYFSLVKSVRNFAFAGKNDQKTPMCSDTGFVISQGYLRDINLGTSPRSLRWSSINFNIIRYLFTLNRLKSAI
jgi:hypothetical protein